MKLVVNSLISSIPQIFNVMLVNFLFYYIFAILALQLLSGKTSFCEVEDIYSIKDKKECLAKGHTWKIPDNNYDTLAQALMTMFEVSTLEMWPDIMYAALDASNTVDGSPVLNNRPWIALLFVSFLFITSFVVLNMFISVIIQKFQAESQKLNGLSALSDTQREWIRVQRFMASVSPITKPKEPEAKWRLVFYKIVQTKCFENTLTTMILLNVLCLCAEFYGASKLYLKWLDRINLFFVFFFTLEAVMKMIGMGLTFYFHVRENIFDFIIVVFSLLGLSSYMIPVNITVFRLIRVTRLLRVISKSRHIKRLLKTLYNSLANLVNVFFLYCLIVFVFTLTGIAMFGESKTTSDAINDNANFRDFYTGAMVLVRISTGESWNDIMHGYFVQGSYNAGVKLFFLSYMFLTFFIFINVLVAVIFEEHE